MASKTREIAPVEPDDVAPVTSRKGPAAPEPMRRDLAASTTARSVFARERVAQIESRRLCMLAEKLGIDLTQAVRGIERNRARYPADEVRGNAKKARRLEAR